MTKIEKKDPARCARMADDLNKTGPYGVTWLGADACVHTTHTRAGGAKGATIMIYPAELVADRQFVAEVARVDDSQIARLTGPDLLTVVRRAVAVAELFNF